MKKFAWVLCLISILLVSACKKNDTLLEESSIVLTSLDATVFNFSTGGWDLNVLVTATNTSEVEGYIGKVEYRFLLDGAVIAATDNINPDPLPDSFDLKWRGFISSTDWHLVPESVSVIKYYDTGLNQFMNGKKPQQVEIILYLRSGSTQGVWDFTLKVVAPILYVDIVEE